MAIDLEKKKLEETIAHLEYVVKILGAKVALLERENNRRKVETNQLTHAIRKVSQ